MKVARKKIARDRAIDSQVARKRITEQVLVDRLSLDEEWLDAENIHGHFHQQLPAKLRRQKPSNEIREIEADVDRLVALGCHRGVVYWCLERLTPDEEQLRFRGATQPVTDEADKPRPHLAPLPRLATQEDMSALTSKLKAASKMIQRYKRELMLTAEALRNEHSLPEGFFTQGPHDPADALLLLQSSMTWASRLARDWAAPQLSTVMRSKGTLYLVAYVAMRSQASEGQVRHKASRRAGAKQNRPVTLGRRDARPVSQLIQACGNLSIHPDDLVAKLRDFGTDYPTLCTRLISLMKHLHTAAQ